MTDLSTEYLGLKLKNPLVPSSSPLTGDFDSARTLEDQGAAALILPSLFEESIRDSEEAAMRFLLEQETGFGEAGSFLPVHDDDCLRTELDEYLEYIQKLKQSMQIPVIASLNGISPEGWTTHARQLQEAGADALELNVYYVATNIEESSAQVEQRYVDVLQLVKQQVDIPVTMKLGSQFSSVGHFVRSLEQAGADGVVLFNRFYQPDIALFTREVMPMLTLSSSYESLLRVNWVATLFGKVKLSMAVTGGVHSADDALKALMAGADVTHLCSILLREGPEKLGEILRNMQAWLQEQEYDSVSQLKGSVSRERAIDPSAYDRANYVEVMKSHRSATGVWR